MCQVAMDPQKVYAIHLDTLTRDGGPCRLSVSNMYDAAAAKVRSRF